MKGLRDTLRVAWVIFLKDIRSEWRSREIAAGMLIFAILVIFLFNFALALDAGARADVSAGVLWTTLIFAGTIGLNRSLAVEKDRSCLDGLLLAPADRIAIYFGKLLINLASMLFVALIIFPLYAWLFNVNILHIRLLWVVLLGTLGYSTAGTLLAGMAMQARTREMLLPVLLFPLVLPLLVAAVRYSAGILAGTPPFELRTWLDLLVVYDLAFMGAALWVFDWIMEE